MDPDGLSILIATASTFGAACGGLPRGRSVRKRTGAAAERHPWFFRQDGRALRGICVCVRIFCLRLSSHFCTGSLVDASVPGGAGRAGRAAVQPWPAKGRIKEKSGFTAACMLGAPLAAPAKLVFKALGLSAQSDVTEEDVLSFVDDVEEHDLIDESQKKMITNIFELDDVTAGDVMTTVPRS